MTYKVGDTFRNKYSRRVVTILLVGKRNQIVVESENDWLTILDANLFERHHVRCEKPREFYILSNKETGRRYVDKIRPDVFDEEYWERIHVREIVSD